MSKRALLSLGLAASLFTPVRAEILKNAKVDGSIEVKSFGINNATDATSTTDDYRSDTRTRLMAGVSFDLLDDVHSRVLLSKNNRVHGGGIEDANTVQSNLNLDNAYVKIDKVFGSVDTMIGRQFYGDGNDLNIYYGPNPDDALTIGSIDAFRVDGMIAGLVRYQGLFGRESDNANSAVNTSNNSTNVFGGEFGYEKIAAANLAAYYYTRKDHNPNNASRNNTHNTIGVRAAGNVLAGVGYNAEYIRSYGRDTTGTDVNGDAFNLGVHAGLTAGVPVRFHASYAHGTELFQGINPGKRYGKIWGEHTSASNGPASANRTQANGLNNLRVFDVGIGANLTPKLGLDFNVYRFQYSENAAGTSAGTEYDLIASWKHSDNVAFEFSAASFQVGSGLSSGAVSPATRLGADVKIKF